MNFSSFFFLHFRREKNSFESEVSGFDESRESWLVMNFANCEDFAKSLSDRNMIYWVIDVFCPRVRASKFKKSTDKLLDKILFEYFSSTSINYGNE